MWVMDLVQGLVIVAKEPYVSKVPVIVIRGRAHFLHVGIMASYFHGLDVLAPLGAGGCHGTKSSVGFMVWA